MFTKYWSISAVPWCFFDFCQWVSKWLLERLSPLKIITNIFFQPGPFPNAGLSNLIVVCYLSISLIWVVSMIGMKRNAARASTDKILQKSRNLAVLILSSIYLLLCHSHIEFRWTWDWIEVQLSLIWKWDKMTLN